MGDSGREDEGRKGVLHGFTNFVVSRAQLAAAHLLLQFPITKYNRDDSNFNTKNGDCNDRITFLVVES